MIKVENVTKKFGSKVAVNNISFEVKDGEIFGFLGPNGAGKTTTIKMIVGLLLPDTGTLKIKNVDVVEDSLEAKKKISYVPDNPDLYDNMTGRQFVNFISNVFGVDKSTRDERIREYSELFELIEDLDTYISNYSHGMKQKLALISALVHDPEVMILDEPMVGLDPKSAFNLKELMRKRCNEGKSVFFSTHVMEVAEKICDRVAIIKNGKIIAIGTLEEIRQGSGNSSSLEEIFLELTE
ncbi:MAG: ABC transporter ATP-binding protein [Tissierellia bacterium]|nr:ABC transporter ATP-binding protein [Tissierellia bacterium]